MDMCCLETHTKTPEPGCRTFPHPTRAGSVLAEAVGSLLPSGWGPRGLFSASVKQAPTRASGCRWRPQRVPPGSLVLELKRLLPRGSSDHSGCRAAVRQGNSQKRGPGDPPSSGVHTPSSHPPTQRPVTRLKDTPWRLGGHLCPQPSGPSGPGDEGLQREAGVWNVPPDLSDTRLPFWAEVRGQSGDWGAQPGCPPAHVPELIKGGTAGTTPGPGGPQSRGAALLGATLEPEGVQGVGGPAEARPTGEGQPLAPHHPPRFWAEELRADVCTGPGGRSPRRSPVLGWLEEPPDFTDIRGWWSVAEVDLGSAGRGLWLGLVGDGDRRRLGGPGCSPSGAFGACASPGLTVDRGLLDLTAPGGGRDAHPAAGAWAPTRSPSEPCDGGGHGLETPGLLDQASQLTDQASLGPGLTCLCCPEPGVGLLGTLYQAVLCCGRSAGGRSVGGALRVAEPSGTLLQAGLGVALSRRVSCLLSPLCPQVPLEPGSGAGPQATGTVQAGEDSRPLLSLVELGLAYLAVTRRHNPSWEGFQTVPTCGNEGHALEGSLEVVFTKLQSWLCWAAGAWRLRGVPASQAPRGGSDGPPPAGLSPACKFPADGSPPETGHDRGPCAGPGRDGVSVLSASGGPGPPLGPCAHLALPGPRGGGSRWTVLGPLEPTQEQRQLWGDERPWQSLSTHSRPDWKEEGTPKGSPTAVSTRPGGEGRRGTLLVGTGRLWADHSGAALTSDPDLGGRWAVPGPPASGIPPKPDLSSLWAPRPPGLQSEDPRARPGLAWRRSVHRLRLDAPRPCGRQAAGLQGCAIEPSLSVETDGSAVSDVADGGDTPGVICLPGFLSCHKLQKEALDIGTGCQAGWSWDQGLPAKHPHMSPCAGSHLFRKAVLGPVFPLSSTPGKCKGSWLFKTPAGAASSEGSTGAGASASKTLGPRLSEEDLSFLLALCSPGCLVITPGRKLIAGSAEAQKFVSPHSNVAALAPQAWHPFPTGPAGPCAPSQVWKLRHWVGRQQVSRCGRERKSSGAAPAGTLALGTEAGGLAPKRGRPRAVSLPPPSGLACGADGPTPGARRRLRVSLLIRPAP
ncbi:collagen alpha-1(I) chain [Bos taurus]|uniref:collagen alpha-1(I) chain n=1 Tax=Bos taurus TaxID=9913 RepID=UPI000572DCBE|nr:collagen alpha-1(I) chain [Bos taurus]